MPKRHVFQVIHNSADAAATEVDVYLDAGLAIDDFQFRTASEFLNIPAEVEVELSIAPANSTSVGDAILTVPVTLTANETYIVVADGIASATGYSPAPALSLQVYPLGREAATSASNTDVLVHHGSTDAPTVDVEETGVGAGIIVDDISYTEFQGYLELPTADYVLQVEAGNVGVAAFSAPLATLNLDGAAIVVVASGFLDPSQNSNGPAFGLWVALPAGGAMVELPAATLGIDEAIVGNIGIYPNPTNNALNLNSSLLPIENATAVITDMQGRVVLQELIGADNSIDVQGLTTGLYVLNVIDVNRVLTTQKFIKN